MPRCSSSAIRASAWASSGLLASLACAPVGSLGKDFPADTGASTTASTHDSTHGDSSGSSTVGTSTTETTTGLHETTTGMHETTSTDSTESTGAPTCPPDVGDDACTTCTKENCCHELAACDADPMCLCLHECHLGGTTLPECEVMCGVDHGENAALEQCMDEQCVPACP